MQDSLALTNHQSPHFEFSVYMCGAKSVQHFYFLGISVQLRHARLFVVSRAIIFRSRLRAMPLARQFLTFGIGRRGAGMEPS